MFTSSMEWNCNWESADSVCRATVYCWYGPAGSCVRSLRQSGTQPVTQSVTLWLCQGSQLQLQGPNHVRWWTCGCAPNCASGRILAKQAKLSKESSQKGKNIPKRALISQNYQQWTVCTGRPASCNPKGSSALVEDLRTFWRRCKSSHCLHQFLTRMVGVSLCFNTSLISSGDGRTTQIEKWEVNGTELVE